MSKVRLFGLAAVLIHLACFVLMLFKVEPFHTLFYMASWWTFIVAISAVNHSRGRNSILFDEPGEFIWLFFASCLSWFLFEAFNFRLENWHYVGLPIESAVRWPSYFLSFGTVFLGIFETETLLKNVGLFSKPSKRVLRVPKGLLIRFIAIGCLMMLAALWSPTTFFPFIWLGLIFLLDPVIYLWGNRSASFLSQFHDGYFGKVSRLLVAGLICGILWEFWNFWAGAKWIYTIPRLDVLHVFEMPVLGYLGFPVFALECYLLHQLFELYRSSRYYRVLALRVMAIFLAAGFSAAVIRGIDEWTVVSYKIFLPH